MRRHLNHLLPRLQAQALAVFPQLRDGALLRPRPPRQAPPREFLPTKVQGDRPRPDKDRLFG